MSTTHWQVEELRKGPPKSSALKSCWIPAQHPGAWTPFFMSSICHPDSPNMETWLVGNMFGNKQNTIPQWDSIGLWWSHWLHTRIPSWKPRLKVLDSPSHPYFLLTSSHSSGEKDIQHTLRQAKMQSGFVQIWADIAQVSPSHSRHSHENHVRHWEKLMFSTCLNWRYLQF